MVIFTLHPEREKSLLRRHPWIFSKAIASVTKDGQPYSKQEIAPGTLVAVHSALGEFCAYAHYSPSSQILLRVISFNQDDAQHDPQASGGFSLRPNFIYERLQQAINKRSALYAEGNHGLRLVAAEGDLLPGLIIDLFNEVVSIAISSWGMEALFSEIVTALYQLLPTCVFYERSDTKARLKENLPLRAGLIDPQNPSTKVNLVNDKGENLPQSQCITALTMADGQRRTLDELVPPTLYVREHDLIDIPIDVRYGHKTGGYLDQRASRFYTYELCKQLKQEAPLPLLNPKAVLLQSALAASIAANSPEPEAKKHDPKMQEPKKHGSNMHGPKILNCFSYTGGFGLAALKGGASQVVNVDVSVHALAAAKAGIAHNHLDPGRCKLVTADVFTFLRNEVKAGHKYDVVILDPPKFIENKSNLVRGCRGYQDINRLGMLLVRPGGHLLTFSCSGLMTEELMQKILADAALEAQVQAQLVTTLRQDRDHMVSLPCPESFYLKGFDLLISPL